VFSENICDEITEIVDSSHFSFRIYTRDMGALSALVEDAHQRYVKTSRPHVIVHTADQVSPHSRVLRQSDF
jgi:hypothetical protein